MLKMWLFHNHTAGTNAININIKRLTMVGSTLNSDKMSVSLYLSYDHSVWDSVREIILIFYTKNTTVQVTMHLFGVLTSLQLSFLLMLNRL